MHERFDAALRCLQMHAVQKETPVPGRAELLGGGLENLSHKRDRDHLVSSDSRDRDFTFGIDGHVAGCKKALKATKRRPLQGRGDTIGEYSVIVRKTSQLGWVKVHRKVIRVAKLDSCINLTFSSEKHIGYRILRALANGRSKRGTEAAKCGEVRACRTLRSAITNFIAC